MVPESSRLCNNTEEGHDKIVKEILRRLEKNDLYIKPEKCIWKVRKIGFLGVVIEPNGIEMETEKVDGVGISILSSNDLFGALSYFSKSVITES